MTKNKVFMAPDKDNEKSDDLKIFLAGTIDDGESVNWQKQICQKLLKSDEVTNVRIYNPRRDDWDKKAGHNEIIRQIEWELEHMNKADIILMNILGDSKSPISLMEIGLHAHEDKLFVFCPKNFYRFDNVKVVCEKYNIPLTTTNNINEIFDKILKMAK